MELIYLLVAPLTQCQSSLCFHRVSGLSLSCFYIASLWLRRFLWRCRRRVFVLYSLCVWSQMPWRRRWIIGLLRGFFCTNIFQYSTDSQDLWYRGSISQKTFLVLPMYFLNFEFYAIALRSILIPSGSSWKVLSMGQIERTVCKQMTDIKLWLLYSNNWNHLTVSKKELRLV